MKQITIILISFLVIASCISTKSGINNKEIIMNSCDLKNMINDTIIVRGKYSRCMEYDGFKTFNRDSCIADFGMELNLKNLKVNQQLQIQLREISDYGCGGSMEMVLKGIVKKDNSYGYGHLGTNDYEFITLEIIKLEKVKFNKLKSK